jgi:glutamine amidotransferase
VIAILDYGLGNVLAFQNIFKRLGIPVSVARTPDSLAAVTKLILPGVGAFDHAISLFQQSGLRSAAEALVRQHSVPILGVCVGMQMLAHGSDEGRLPGLGWVPGRVRKLDASRLNHPTRLPHMGWNDVRPLQPSPLFRALETDARFYFLHSYYFAPDSIESTLAVTEYGGEFACAVRAGHVYGVQFHPEKSHHFGSQLLQNFAERA